MGAKAYPLTTKVEDRGTCQQGVLCTAGTQFQWMYDNVLVATDGSSGTTETLAHAVSIARDNDAVLHGLYVVDRRLFLAAEKDTQDDVRQSLTEEGEVALDDIEVGAAEAGLTVETQMKDGIPHKAITDYAEEADVDLVVMGTHGRTGRDRVANLGSVTERVVESSPVPVLVVHID